MITKALTSALRSECARAGCQFSVSLVPRPHPLTRKRVWWLLSNFLVVLSQQSWFWMNV